MKTNPIAQSASRLAGALLLAALLAGCSTLVPPPDGPTPTEHQALAAWSRVLARHVDTRGRVDFAALACDRGDLDTYLRHVAARPLAPSSDTPSPEQLAHQINAYNAQSMAGVIDRGIPASHGGLEKVAFFVLRKPTIGGRPLSLYAFENDVIRPYARRLGRPEVHFALNCSAASCPVLPREPFAGPRLATQLDEEARRFFARPENFRYDPATGTLWLNEILRFYTEDFVPDHGRDLVAYANRWAPRPAPADARVRFTPYDWTIANQREHDGPIPCTASR